MTENNKLTLEDIKKARDLLMEELPRGRMEFNWGWIETDWNGIPITIGLSEQTIKDLKKYMPELYHKPSIEVPIKMKTVMGMQIVVTDNLPNSQRSVCYPVRRHIKGGHVDKYGVSFKKTKAKVVVKRL